jgi:hypothetical protein
MSTTSLKKRTPILAAVALICLAAAPTFGQAKRPARILTRIDKPVPVDAVLNTASWNKARALNDAVPVHTADPSVPGLPTSVKILFDGTTIYFGFVCVDPKPDEIIVHASSHDASLRTDDAVFVLVDPHRGDGLYDVFGVNAWGTTFEAEVSPDGEFFNPKWNAEWRAAAQTVEAGWVAEIAIPVLALSAQKNLPAVGVQFARVVPRLSRSLWNGDLDPAFDFSRPERFIDLDLLRGGVATSLKASVLSMADSGELSARPSLEASHEFSPALTASLAANPDFRTVEPDDEVINLTRFELRFPERRGFFQDPTAGYETPILVYYSKRIPDDLYAGLKLEGTGGGLSYSLLSAQSREARFYEPATSNFSVLRVRKEGPRFSVGVLGVNRITAGQDSGAASIDGTFALTSTWHVAGQAVLSFGPSGGTAPAFYVGSRFETSTVAAHAEFTYLDDSLGEIVNAFGFVPDDDRKEIGAGLEFSLFPKTGKLDRVRLGVEADGYWGLDNVLRGWMADPYLTLQLGKTYAITVFHSEDFQRFEADYRDNATGIKILLDPLEEWQRAELGLTFGRLFGGSFVFAEGAKWLVLTDTARFVFNLSYLKYDTPASLNPHNRNASGIAFNLRFYYDFSADLTATVSFHMGTKAGFYLRQPRTVLDRNYFQALVQYRILAAHGLIQAGYQKADYEFDLSRPNLIQNGAFLRLCAIL